MLKWNNEPTSFITHCIGALFAVAGLVLLLVKAAQAGTALHVTSLAIFGTTLVLLYAASSLYHIVPKESLWKARLQILDHSMIFLLIAGTYTPVALVGIGGAWGWSVFGSVWGLALVGLIIKAVPFLRRSVPHALIVALYAVMGWLALVAIVPLVKSLSGGALALLFAGGGAYTLGIVFFALDTMAPRKSKWYGHHEIWHVFVIAGSVCHFCLAYVFLFPV